MPMINSNAVLWVTRCSALLGEVIAVAITVKRTVDFQSLWRYHKAPRESISYVLLENGIGFSLQCRSRMMHANPNTQVLLVFCKLSDITTAFTF